MTEPRRTYRPHSQSKPSRTNVLLTGLSGAGKTSVGEVLARRLGYGFCDLDHWIRRREGRAISEIFEASGESGFREAEAAAFEALEGLQFHVIALGGGTLTSEANWQVARRLGTVVWRACSPRIIATRLCADKELSKRPAFAHLLSEGDREVRWQKIYVQLGELLARRQTWYERADIINCESFAPVEETARGIALDFAEFARASSGQGYRSKDGSR